jgi:hypothetical protein
MGQPRLRERPMPRLRPGRGKHRTQAKVAHPLAFYSTYLTSVARPSCAARSVYSIIGLHKHTSHLLAMTVHSSILYVFLAEALGLSQTPRRRSSWPPTAPARRRRMRWRSRNNHAHANKAVRLGRLRVHMEIGDVALPSLHDSGIAWVEGHSSCELCSFPTAIQPFARSQPYGTVRF